MWKLCGQNNKLCTMCLYWDGYRLGHIVHDSAILFKYDNTKKAKCMYPKGFAHFEKTPTQMCPTFEKRF